MKDDLDEGEDLGDDGQEIHDDGQSSIQPEFSN